MCLAILAYKHHPDYPLILTSNRDEFYNRPTLPADWWEDHPEILAGRDKEKGGTWLGISKNGRFALVTNYRQFPISPKENTSRGSLITEFLTNNISAKEYGKQLAKQGHLYEGYNLIWGNENSLFYYSNKNGAPKELQPGIYGLSNHLLDTPWPKVKKARLSFTSALYRSNKIDTAELFSALQDKSIADDNELPSTGIEKEWERALSPCFIETEKYGTRTTTTLLINKKGYVNFNEFTHATNQEKAHSFQIYE